MKTSITSNFSKFLNWIEDKKNQNKVAIYGCIVVVAIIIIANLLGFGWIEKY